ncbi:hypothetical protein EV368DRAFT_65213 [Lentinula lateritia]|nr:hypothetical protein EV368DRAFT_65213 [Lentinula lateritia]
MVHHAIGYNDLPLELHHLVAEEITDTQSLLALTFVSQNLHIAYNPELFKSVNKVKGLITLATAQNERYPLRDTHPAAFVRHLDIWIPHEDLGGPEAHRKEVKLTRIVQEHMPRALHNISLYGRKATLRSLTIDLHIGTTSFAKLIGNIDEGKELFGSLQQLSIRCCFPVNDFRQSLVKLKMALGPSLLSIEFHRPLDDEVDGPTAADPRSFSKFLSQVGERCGNLTRLCIEVPGGQRKPFHDLQAQFDDRAFTFPSLEVFSLTDRRSFSQSVEHTRALDITTFIQRHRDIRELAYHCLHEMSFTENQDIVPNLTRFSGYLPEAGKLCKNGRRPLESLVVLIDRRSNEVVERDELYKDLKQTATIRRLIVQDTRHHQLFVEGICSYDIHTIVEACPNLTHLQCTFNQSATATLLESMLVLRNLSELEHLKILAVQGFCGVFKNQHDETLRHADLHRFAESSGRKLTLKIREALNQHQRLQTVLVVVYGWFGQPRPLFERPPIEVRFAFRKKNDGFHIERQIDNKEWDFGSPTCHTAIHQYTRHVAGEAKTFEILRGQAPSIEG